MKIRHERPLPELAYKVTAPLMVEMPSGDVVRAERWSLQGLELPTVAADTEMDVVLSVPFQGFDVRFPVRLEPTQDEQVFGFPGLTGRQRETLAVFYHSILSGKMASSEDIITSLDTPVDLVPMGETEEEAKTGKEGKSPRSVRVLFNLAVYALIAGLTVWTLGKGIWSGIATVDIKNARVEANLVPLAAPEGGFAKKILVERGDRVKQGEILIEVVTPETSAALNDARSRINLIEARLAEAEKRRDDLAQVIDVERAQLLDATYVNEGRTEALAKLEAFNKRLSLEHRPLFQAHTSAMREIDILEDELRRLRRERGSLRDAADALHVIAPEDGAVEDVLVLRDQYLARGQTVVVIEGSEPRRGIGWLDQGMASAVYPGMSVKVSTTLGGKQVFLKGVVEDVTAGVNEALSPDFGATVAVAILDRAPADLRLNFPHHKPLQLQVTRPWATRLEQRLQSLPFWYGE